jgi:hypothetical protein
VKPFQILRQAVEFDTWVVQGSSLEVPKNNEFCKVFIEKALHPFHGNHMLNNMCVISFKIFLYPCKHILILPKTKSRYSCFPSLKHVSRFTFFGFSIVPRLIISRLKIEL